MIALVGNDGTRPVVWGIGFTPEEAREDAAQWLAEGQDEPVTDAQIDALEPHQITGREADIVRAGGVAWPITTSLLQVQS